MYDRSHLLHTNGVNFLLVKKSIHEFRTLNCVRTDCFNISVIVFACLIITFMLGSGVSGGLFLAH